MRVIAAKTLRDCWTRYPLVKQSLLTWYEEAEGADGSSPNELKQEYRFKIGCRVLWVLLRRHGGGGVAELNEAFRMDDVFFADAAQVVFHLFFLPFQLSGEEAERGGLRDRIPCKAVRRPKA